MQVELTPNRNTTSIDLTTIISFFERHWFNALILALGMHIVLNKEISIQFNINDAEQGREVQAAMIQPQEFSAKPAALVETKSKEKEESKPSKKKKWDSRKANDFSNLTFILSPDYGERHNVRPEIVKLKIQNCKDYVAQYVPVAIEEMEKYGIPASITLAQGLLESNAGDSRLSKESNNHFGIKCRSKCRGCTCRNYTDDDIYDMFRVFESPWESYREHSKLLQGKRYRHLLKLDITDYEGWSHGLKKAGYATDKRYAYKLIQIIEELNLYRYDK
jgi:flagellum-specific peptidoglycan hydrolase FlgJ